MNLMDFEVFPFATLVKKSKHTGCVFGANSTIYASQEAARVHFGGDMFFVVLLLPF